MVLNVDKKRLLNELELWKAYGIEDDVLWREEYKSFIDQIKTKHPEYNKEQIIETLEKELKC